MIETLSFSSPVECHVKRKTMFHKSWTCKKAFLRDDLSKSGSQTTVTTLEWPRNAANLGVVVVVEVICLLWDGRFLVRLVLVAVSVSMSMSREAQLIV